MNLLDLIVLMAIVAAAAGGYRLGFLARFSSWVGMFLGLVVTARVIPWILDRLDGSDDMTQFVLATSMLVMGAFAGQAFGLLVGSELRSSLPGHRSRRADHLAGATAGVVGVAVAAWLLVPAMEEVDGWPSSLSEGSLIAEGIADLLPAPPDTLGTVGRIVGADRFPQVFTERAPAQVGPPPADSGLDAATAAGVGRSIVRVEAVACGRIQEGTGVVVGRELVLTNAHVVAGQESLRVEEPDGRERTASVVAFDSRRDLAVVAVRGLELPSLEMSTGASIGDIGGVFGHPGGGGLAISPYRIDDALRARGRDLYDREDIDRDVLVLGAALEPGDSGAPLVAPDGIMVGLAFAVAPDGSEVAYALTVTEVEAFLATNDVTVVVSSGPCVL